MINKKTKAKKTQKKGNKSDHGTEDIVELILGDHKPLKQLIKIIKDTEKDFAHRKEAFEEFGPLLLEHAKPEAKVLYECMKDQEDLREEGLEGNVEHDLAEQVLKESLNTEDAELFSARIKILAELVEHHIEEEEEELLPDFKKHSEKETRQEMGKQYLSEKQNFEKKHPRDFNNVQESSRTQTF